MTNASWESMRTPYDLSANFLTQSLDDPTSNITQKLYNNSK